MTPLVPTADRTAAAATSPPLGRWRALVAMTRPSQLALIGLIFANGVLLGLWRGASTTAGLGAIAAALLLVLLAAASVHLANEAADHDTDRLT
ncbi:MAG: prenyltransferase, partial [Chloroflexota bacterium]